MDQEQAMPEQPIPTGILLKPYVLKPYVEHGRRTTMFHYYNLRQKQGRMNRYQYVPRAYGKAEAS
ncbi:hypothetical protein HYU19_01715 [Candidatus Woesearchaeota archaeon]|nr:hypothetical protein [Candidatus Woesearchaeota archaeon]